MFYDALHQREDDCLFDLADGETEERERKGEQENADKHSSWFSRLVRIRESVLSCQSTNGGGESGPMKMISFKMYITTTIHLAALTEI